MSAVVCIHCAMKAVLGGTAIDIRDETPEEHMLRCHPGNYADTVRERRELERQLAERGDDYDVKFEGDFGQKKRGRDTG